jgi:hypothetical protein
MAVMLKCSHSGDLFNVNVNRTKPAIEKMYLLVSATSSRERRESRGLYVFDLSEVTEVPSKVFLADEIFWAGFYGILYSSKF